ncbi:MAG TPA: hypothetical protein VHN16_00110 [Streptosporangiaceae bacterium]|nr:hypothetical protein [Streptosporangiaceae bacterium]
MLETFAAAARAGAPGVHVCVVASNVKAIGFYRRLGFGTLMADEPGGVIYLGRKLLPTRHPRATRKGSPKGQPQRTAREGTADAPRTERMRHKNRPPRVMPPG